MRIRSFKLRFLLFSLIASVGPVLVVAAIICFTDFNGKLMSDNAERILKMGALFILALSFFLNIFLYNHISKIWSSFINEIRKGIIAISTGEYEQKVDFPEEDEFIDIQADYAAMTEKLRESKRELELQSLEIYAKNLEIQQANSELEASYGQLQATINQLNDSEQKYYSLVKNIADIVCVIRMDGSIYFINEVVNDILGYDKKEVEGRNIKELVKPDISEDFFEKISNELKTKNSLMLEMEMLAKSGKTVLIEATITNFIYDGEVIGIQAILRDITEKKKMEQEIISSYKELATINSLSRKLNATLEIKYVLDLVVQEICRVLKSPLCTVSLLDESETSLITKAFAGEYFEGMVENINDFPVYSTEDSIFKRVFDSVDTVIKQSVDISTILKKINLTKKDNEKIKELLMAPIKTKDKHIGVLTVGSVSKFNSRQKNLLSSITNNAAIAIENARLYELSRKNFIKTVNALIAAIEAKDKYTQGHSYRVSKYAVILAEKMGLSKEQVDEIRIAGILHDIGKIGIPDAILVKPSRLTDEEYEMIKKHPTISNRILRPVGLTEGTMKAITYHHERWDGKGYPFGLASSQLSIEAQIISVADALDAMTSNRAYRKALTEEEAVAEILKGKNTQFSPYVVDALTELIKIAGMDILKDNFD